MTLRARLLAAFAYALLIVIIALEVPLVANLNDRVDAEVERDSAAQAQVVAASIADQLGQPERLDAVTAEASERLGGRVFIVDGRGRLLADSASEAVPGSDFATETHPPLLEALDGKIAQGTHPPDLDVLSTAVPIVRRGRTIGVLEVEQSLDKVNSEVRDDVAALIGVGVLALVIGLGVAWILAGSLARPMHALAGAARRMADGDLSARAPAKGSSEQVEVASSFNEMADQLSAMLASQRAFVADASHQLRTPLTGLRLRLEAAGEKARSSGAVEEIEAAERETERLSRVVSDLLALAASEEPAEPQRAELSSVADRALDRWRETAAGEDRELRVSDTPTVEVRAGERDLAVILDNLIDNAINYSPRGSRVELDWDTDDAEATLSVINEGAQLPSEDAERAFERFYRGSASRRARGTGLGLAIVDAMARRSGGRARLRARRGGGAVAEVTLPLEEDDFADS